MNLFLLHDDPEVNAWLHHDKHVVKMVLETAQIMCTVAHSKGIDAPYKPTHKNHPVTKWACESNDNLCNLANVGYYLAKEYTRRYGKIHKSSHVIKLIATKLTGDSSHYEFPQSFVQCFPDEYKNEDPFQGYRSYYKAEKLEKATWKN